MWSEENVDADADVEVLLSRTRVDFGWTLLYVEHLFFAYRCATYRDFTVGHFETSSKVLLKDQIIHYQILILMCIMRTWDNSIA